MTQMDLLSWQPRYPAAPGAKVSGTSTEAAEAMRPRAGILRAKVLAALRAKSMTADECADVLNETVLSIRPRFSELRARNLIIDTGLRGINSSGRRATVWRAAHELRGSPHAVLQQVLPAAERARQSGDAVGVRQRHHDCDDCDAGRDERPGGPDACSRGDQVRA